MKENINISEECSSTYLKENLKVILIGGQQYDDFHLPNLNGTANDVRCLYDFLRNNWQIEDNQILRMENETREKGVKRIRDFLGGLSEKDHLLFYYAGHGFLGDGARGKSYLTFRDTRYVPRKDGGGDLVNVMSLNYLNRLFLKCKANIKVRVFDSCHSGERVNSLEDYFKKDGLQEGTGPESKSGITENGAISGETAASENAAISGKTVASENADLYGKTVRPEKSGTSGENDKGGMQERFFRDIMKNQKGWITFCSCNIDEFSNEKVFIGDTKSRGVFSYYFVKGLQMIDECSDGEPFYIEDLKNYVYRSMEEENRKLLYPQHMQYQCSIGGNIRLN